MDTYNTTSSYLQPSILRLRYSIELADASLHSETEAQIREIAGIADVRTDDTITDGFSSIKNIAIICGSVLAFIMIVSSALIMSNSIKLSMANRREELEIMSMVGAYDSFLYVPLFVEGIITGWVSSVIATILAVGIYACVSKLIKTTSIISLISLVPANELIGRLAIINILIGTIIGAIGTISACRKFLRSLECQI
jgi:cell division transport system permease protein